LFGDFKPEGDETAKIVFGLGSNFASETPTIGNAIKPKMALFGQIFYPKYPACVMI